MSIQLLKELEKIGFLTSSTIDGNNVLHLNTPCRFKLVTGIVNSLKVNYKPEEEIGGLFWAKPTISGEEKIYVIGKVSYLRNAIEDIQRNDGHNKSNAYLPNDKELKIEMDAVFNNGCLPIRFHTHPIKGTSFYQSLINHHFHSETSEQDIRVSNIPYSIDGKKLLLPRGLVVGNETLGNDIFIGVYNGFVAPTKFEESKHKIQEKNLKKASDTLSTIELNDKQTAALFIGAILLLFAILRYGKYSLPIILGIIAAIPLLATSTQFHKNPEYFCKLSTGEANIYIPKIE